MIAWKIGNKTQFWTRKNTDQDFNLNFRIRISSVFSPWQEMRFFAVSSRLVFNPYRQAHRANQ